MENSQTCLTQIVHVLSEITYEKMPEDVKQKSKECLMDFIGIFLAGTTQKMSRQLRKALNTDLISRTEDFALFMGSTARMLDIDDGHRFAMAHPGVVINSAALAVTWSLNKISGQALLEAIVKGYEIYCYQGRCINPSAYLKRGIDATCVCGAAAAAVTAGSLLKLDQRQMEDAVSLAASLAGGLNQSAIDGSAQKYLVAGWGAKLGIAAANMAKFGLGGPSHVFEGKLGFCNAFAPEPNYDYLNNPHLVWDIRSVYIKRYACVRRIHATLDAIRDIVTENKLTAADITKVIVSGSQFLYDAGGYEPQDMAQAQTSVPYTVSLLLYYGGVEERWVHENLNNKEMIEYSHRIAVEKDQEIIAMAEKDKSLWGAAKVEVFTQAGKIYYGKQITPYGDPEMPLPVEAVQEKFLGNVSSISNQEYAEMLWQVFLNINTTSDSGEIMRTLLKLYEDKVGNKILI